MDCERSLSSYLGSLPLPLDVDLLLPAPPLHLGSKSIWDSSDDDMSRLLESLGSLPLDGCRSPCSHPWSSSPWGEGSTTSGGAMSMRGLLDELPFVFFLGPP